ILALNMGRAAIAWTRPDPRIRAYCGEIDAQWRHELDALPSPDRAPPSPPLHLADGRSRPFHARFGGIHRAPGFAPGRRAWAAVAGDFRRARPRSRRPDRARRRYPRYLERPRRPLAAR